MANELHVSLSVINRIIDGSKALCTKELDIISKFLNISTDNLINEKHAREDETLDFNQIKKAFTNQNEAYFICSLIQELLNMEEDLSIISKSDT